MTWKVCQNFREERLLQILLFLDFKKSFLPHTFLEKRMMNSIMIEILRIKNNVDENVDDLKSKIMKINSFCWTRFNFLNLYRLQPFNPVFISPVKILIIKVFFIVSFQNILAHKSINTTSALILFHCEILCKFLFQFFAWVKRVTLMFSFFVLSAICGASN